MKKYKLTNETIDFYGRTLYRIECVTSFNDVKKGDKGGYVESESNLSQDGDAWVYGHAKVYGDAEVFDDAKVYDNAEVDNKAKVSGHAEIFGDAWVFDNAKVYGDAEVFDKVWVCGNAEVHGNAEVYGNVIIRGNAEVYGHAKVYGNVIIRGNAIVKENEDYIVFLNNWSSGRYFTYTKSNDMWAVGCFYGTGQELIEKAYNDSELSGKNYEAYVKLVEYLKTIQSGD